MTTEPQHQPHEESHDPKSGIERLTPSVTCEWAYGGQIIVISATDSTRATVDAWAGYTEAIMRDWSAGKPFLCLQDLSANQYPVTPYARHRSRALVAVRPDLELYMAMIVPQTLVWSLLQRGFRMMKRKNITMRLFFSREDGLKWLEKIAESRVK